MLQLGILPWAVQDMYLSLVCGWAPLSLECSLDIAFHWAFGLGMKRDNGRGEMPMDGSSPQFLVLPCPTQTPTS